MTNVLDEVDYPGQISATDPRQSWIEAKRYLQRFEIQQFNAEHKQRLQYGVVLNPIPLRRPQNVILKNIVTGLYRSVPREGDIPRNSFFNGDYALVPNYTTGNWKVVNTPANHPQDFPAIGGAAQTVAVDASPVRWSDGA